ncbi:MAG: adenylate/guanylate cyclase domain-containing protein [Treponema sp.]|nr:adenylate/guanylate cyclase domain-containing protein [Treponema sp.]
MKKRGKKSRNKKKAAAFIITGAVFLVVLLLHLAGAFTFLEYKTYDLRVNTLAGLSRPSDDIIVVLLNQESIDWANMARGWGWPWPRSAYAEIVDYMRMGGAKSIAFDVIFSEPSIYRNARQDDIIDTAVDNLEKYDEAVQQAMEQRAQAAAAAPNGETSGRLPPGAAVNSEAPARHQGAADSGTAGAGRQRQGFSEGRQSMMNIIGALRTLSSREDDATFAESSSEFGRVVQTVVLSQQTGNMDTWPVNLDKPLFQLYGFESIIGEYQKLNQNVDQAKMRAQFPVKELRDSAGIIGNVTGWPDSDSIFRRANLFSVFDGKAIPGLSTASLLVSGSDNRLMYDKSKSEIVWENCIPGFDDQGQPILEKRTIPVDSHGRSLLHFRGSLDRYIPYSAHEILMSKEALENGTTADLGNAYLPPEDFKGKYVFFGFYAQGLFDIATTPISSVYPGVGMHITMLDNLLSNDFIRPSTMLFDTLMILISIVLVSLLAFGSNRIPLVVTGLVIILLAIIGFGFGAYYFANYWAPLASPLIGALLTFFAAILYSYATEGSQRRFIKSAFSQYLSPLVIDQLVANPGLLNLGGEKREISIFFSDIQGFTTISEKFKDDPPKLTELLNDYLSFMTDTILESGGTIDKYEGDAIIAFWNAPLNYPDHAARAIHASLKCQELLAERQEFFEEKFGARLLTRIGLNTGHAVVGNMGSHKRFDYTMLGDAVNLAARLEGLNKQFGTYLMCTEETLGQARKSGFQGNDFYGRKLAQVAVVGKKEAVTVWEPMSKDAYEEKKAILSAFGSARDLFYAGKFSEALTHFEALIQSDTPSGFYAEQCRYYIERPSEWKGHWEAKTK